MVTAKGGESIWALFLSEGCQATSSSPSPLHQIQLFPIFIDGIVVRIGSSQFAPRISHCPHPWLTPRQARGFGCDDEAPMAQLVEQLTLNQWVPGSSPGGCTKIEDGRLSVGPRRGKSRIADAVSNSRFSVFDLPSTLARLAAPLFRPQSLLHRVDAGCGDPAKDRAFLFDLPNRWCLEHLPLPDNRQPDQAFIGLFKYDLELVEEIPVAFCSSCLGIIRSRRRPIPQQL
jgi:hypothetical protein